MLLLKHVKVIQLHGAKTVFVLHGLAVEGSYDMKNNNGQEKKATLDDLAQSHRLYVDQLEKVAMAAKVLTQLVDEREAIAIKHSMGNISASSYKLHGKVMNPKVKKVRAKLRRELKILEDGLTEPDCKDPKVIMDLLTLVGVFVEQEQVKQWTDKQKREAAHWAVATHLKASDNDDDVDVPRRPDFLPTESK